jgi:hypothetical protein
VKGISPFAAPVYAANFLAGAGLSSITRPEPTWFKALVTLHGLAQLRFKQVQCRKCGHVDKPSRGLASYRFAKDVLRLARREGWL